METSMTLMTAQIHFIHDQVSLIHIPLEQYTTYLQPILQLLFPTAPSGTRIENEEENGVSTNTWANQHSFLNVSITPMECSVVCSKALAEQYFAPVVVRDQKRAMAGGALATISSESFIVISVEGSGTQASQRVLELTSPLALAGISIFFITTYFSDYILVPARCRGQVVRALEERGFAFEKGAEAYVNPSVHHHHHRNASSSSSFEVKPPRTPPPTTVSELQARTFSLLRRRNITPKVHRDIPLISCAGRRDSPGDHVSHELELQAGLTKCLVHPPRFLSLTLTEPEPASLLMERCCLSNFRSPDVLLGSKEDYLFPITLNLEPLPFEATGIVCGVAGKLAVGTSERLLDDAVEISYLSTARAGTVMVDEKDLERAVQALRSGEYGLDVL